MSFESQDGTPFCACLCPCVFFCLKNGENDTVDGNEVACLCFPPVPAGCVSLVFCPTLVPSIMAFIDTMAWYDCKVDSDEYAGRLSTVDTASLASLPYAYGQWDLCCLCLREPCGVKCHCLRRRVKAPVFTSAVVKTSPPVAAEMPPAQAPATIERA